MNCPCCGCPQSKIQPGTCTNCDWRIDWDVDEIESYIRALKTNGHEWYAVKNVVDSDYVYIRLFPTKEFIHEESFVEGFGAYIQCGSPIDITREEYPTPQMMLEASGDSCRTWRKIEMLEEDELEERRRFN